jgi:hypothetical protein
MFNLHLSQTQRSLTAVGTNSAPLSPTWEKGCSDYYQNNLTSTTKSISNLTFPSVWSSYRLSQAELKAQKEWLNDNLENGFI